MLPVGIYISCNIDNLLLLMLLFCTPLFPVRSIVISQFFSQAIMMLISMAIAALAFKIPLQYVGLAGLMPLTIGIKNLADRARHQRGEQADPCEEKLSTHSSVTAITLLMLSTGGDNLSVYVPLFRANPPSEVLYFCSVFFLMSAAWCALSHYLATHPLIGRIVQRYSARFLPWNMIGLGVYVLSGSLRVLLRH
jgi:cadmium resistance protein CadD (predicted permease)